MRICITRSSRNAYSETFIRDQIKGFEELTEVVSIHSGRFPERREDGTLISPKLFWILHKSTKWFLGRNNFFSNYGMRKFLKEKNIDVVLSNYGISASHMVPVCKTLKIPLLVIFHGHDATDKKILKNYKKKYQKLFEYASFIIPVSEDMKKRLIAEGANPNKVKVVPCGVDILKFNSDNNNYKNTNFIAVGRFTPKKGPLHTLMAFKEVNQKCPDSTLTMVGSKEGLFSKCEDFVKEHKLENSVIFTGVLKQEEIAKLMNKSQAFVQHSITAPNGDMEGTPVSIMEASASGLPVVSTLHGGIKDAVVHGSTGFLVEEKDEKTMADYMVLLFEAPDLAKTMGENGRLHIQNNYQQEQQIKKLFTLAEESLKM
ncbi:MAG: glycosyltransferase family 4 protein [Flavobacteriaceae bacterium]